MTKQQYQRQVARQSKRLEPIGQELSRLQPQRRSLVAIPFGKSPEWAWTEGSIDIKRALLTSVIEQVTVLPGRAGRARFRPDHVEIVPVPEIGSLPVVAQIVHITRSATAR